MSYSPDIWIHQGVLSCVSGFPDVVGVGGVTASLSGAALLTRRAGSNRHKRSSSRGLGLRRAIPAIASESQIHIYSANIAWWSIPQYFAVLHCENF